MVFSVVIPAYNCEKTIERCLLSVRRQTFRDFEVIIVDDGSTDSTGELCRSFVADDRRFLYCYKENGGVSSARNYGISKAGGRYVTFLDSDDVYWEQYLSAFYELMMKYPEVEHFWCGYQYMSEDGKNERRIVRLDHTCRECVVDRTGILTLQEKELAAPIWNKVYVRDILVKNHIEMPSDLSLGEDYIFNLKYLDCCSHTEIVMLNDANYLYYVSSEESLNQKYRRDLWRIYNRLLDAAATYLKKWDIPGEEKRKLATIAFYMYDCVLRNTFHEKNQDSFLSKIRYNNCVLRSRRFRNALKFCHVGTNKAYLKLYSYGHYGLLLMVDELIRLKKAGKQKMRIRMIKRK